MATATAPTLSPLPSVKVNIRLCGSIPRQEIEGISLTKCAPLVLLSSQERNTSPDVLRRSTHFTIEDNNNDDKNCVATQLCSHLCSMQQQRQQQQPQTATAPQRLVLPEFEAPTWAVPARGEARLEVSMLSLLLSWSRIRVPRSHDSSILSMINSQYAIP
jgi:hypothetical protein